MSLSVSIVVPSYQGVERLPRLLNALEGQKTTCKWQVIIVLDGSNDGSKELLESWQARLPLKVIARDHNLGRSATLNEGFAAAEYDVLVRCDDDLVPGPNHVQTFSNLVSANPNAGFIGLCRNHFDESKYARAYGHVVDQRFAAAAYKNDNQMTWHYWAANCGVSRQVFDQVGDYDAGYRQYGYEDVDWGYRLSKVAKSITIVPELEAIHFGASTSAASRCERARWSGRASARFNQKHAYLPPAPAKSLWNQAVKITSRFSGKSLGRAIDLTLVALPPKVALRVIDLAVQSAFVRGQREANG